MWDYIADRDREDFVSRKNNIGSMQVDILRPSEFVRGQKNEGDNANALSSLQKDS